MRIKNKYLRNRHKRNCAWHRAKQIEGGEFTQKWFFPSALGGFMEWPVEQQKEYHQRMLETHWVRTFLKGGKRGAHKSPRQYRNFIERRHRRKVKNVIDKIQNTVHDMEDLEVPNFKYNADWDWF